MSAEAFAARMTQAAEAAVEAELIGLLITPGPDLAYLCGYQPGSTERLTMLMLAKGRQPVLMVPTLERPDAQAATAGTTVALADWADGTDPYQAMAKLLDPYGRYGISDAAWAMHLLGLQQALPDTVYVSLTQALPMLRAVKDSEELARLAAAGVAADATYNEIIGGQFEGRREAEVAADIAALLIKNGHSQVDFTIVGSGPNGANPHHAAGDRIIQAGDVVVLDFGGLKDGYGSDTTRTVYVGQSPPDEVRTVHEVVQRAQQAAFEAVAPGVQCQQIDRVARQVITEAGYGDYFIHRTGHGIGLSTHEPPYLVAGEQQPLVPGMCFSIEPGIYLPGKFGVRIEDIVTVTADGGRRLNNTSADLRTVR
jgi:Xaa-Pro aminopeptidase